MPECPLCHVNIEYVEINYEVFGIATEKMLMNENGEIDHADLNDDIQDYRNRTFLCPECLEILFDNDEEQIAEFLKTDSGEW